MVLSDNMGLLILDERSSVVDKVACYGEVNKRLIDKYQMNGITVLTNDDAIAGEEYKLHKLAGIRFFEDWQNNSMYRAMIRECLDGDDVFIMKPTPDGWIVEEAGREDYDVINPDGLTQAKPKH